MNELLAQIRAAAAATLMLALLCCGAYPLAVTAVARAVFPERAAGSLLRDAAGRVRGSRLIGQPFAAPRYFHPRPSAAGAGYDAANSGGSNLGPTSRKLRDQVAVRVASYRAENGLAADATVPADAVTASASGLDPHISPRNAELQSPRVAKARGLPVHAVLDCVARATEPGGLFGQTGVNVLRANLALDALQAAAPATAGQNLLPGAAGAR